MTSKDELTRTAKQAVQHATCQREASSFLAKIASPKEKERTAILFESIVPSSSVIEEQEGQSPPNNALSDTAPPLTSNQGWCYTATRNAAIRNSQLTASIPCKNTWISPQLVPATTSFLSDDNNDTGLGASSPSRQQYASNKNASTMNDDQMSSVFPQQGPQDIPSELAAMQAEVARKALQGKQQTTTTDVAADTTTYQLAYHLAQMYPDLYERALAGTKAKPAPNYNFQSAWGDSLKKAAAQGNWALRFLRTLYDATNAEVHPDKSPATRKPHALGAAGHPPPGEAEFFKWIARQRTYYQDLIKEELQPAIDDKLVNNSREQQHCTLDTLRQLHAVARPELLVSHLKAEHNYKQPVEDTGLTSTLREHTKLRTMGAPIPRVDIKQVHPGHQHNDATSSNQDQNAPIPNYQGPHPEAPTKVVDLVFNSPSKGQRPFTANPASARKTSSTSSPGLRPTAHGGGSGRLPSRPASACAGILCNNMNKPFAYADDILAQLSSASQAGSLGISKSTSASASSPKVKLTGPPVKLEKDTFKSKLPIKWAAAANLNMTTTYTSAFGSLAGGAHKRLASAGSHRPVRMKEVTAPYGAVNPATAVVPEHSMYPVPDFYTQTKTFPASHGDATMATISRISYSARSKEDMMRTIKASQEASAVASERTFKSTLPLGPKAICMFEPAQWSSEKQAHYVEHQMDVAGDYQTAKLFKRLNGGPTASAGKLTASHPDDTKVEIIPVGAA